MNRIKDKIELSDIFEQYGQEYRQKHNLCQEQVKAMEAIENCRTSKLGGHKLKCNECGHEQISYNSCRNRHCPKCQMLKQLMWVDKLKAQLLPVRYFHIVFTLPEELRLLVYINQKILYDALFIASSYALKKVALNPAFLGAETGSVAVLHTWGQSLTYHPHLHMLVPAGGLDPDGWEWKHSSRKFFVPVKALSKVFRGKFLEILRLKYEKKELTLPQNTEVIQYNDFESLKKILYMQNWNVYIKKTFGGPGQVISYLGRYTHRVAISNSRLISIENNKVRFSWKDYKNHNKWKEMELSAEEFIRRFMQHILPCGFYKIRYFGLFASVNRKIKIARCFQLLGTSPDIPSYEGLPCQIILEMLTGKDIFLCPACKKGRLLITSVFKGK